MKYYETTLGSIMVMGIEIRTTFVSNECYQTIPAFWQQVKKEKLLKKIPNKVHTNEILGIYTDYSADFSLQSGSFAFIIGCQIARVRSIPHDFLVKEIPSSKYAVFTAKGPFAQAIPNTWQTIWQTKEIERAFTNDIEWYTEKSTDDEHSNVEIYVSIK